MVMYALILALFLPLAALFSHLDSRTQVLEQAKLQSTVFYVDQLRVALAAYRAGNPGVDKEIETTELSFPDLLKQSLRSDIKHYVDDQGFYIVWEKDDATDKKPPPGLASALVDHYSRSTGQMLNQGGVKKAYQVAFYHVGFANDQQCLVTTRAYVQTTPPSAGCLYPLPNSIPEGSLVLTDRQAAN